MEEKKGFFDMLSPKSALLVGAVAGLLTLGTIGFIVMLATLSDSSGTALKVAAETQQPAANQNTPAATPAASTPTVTKSKTPVVELFIMAYCPYGLQMEKAFLPVMQLLKNKADLSIKFVNYVMHGKKEIDENTRQYCIQSEQPAKYFSYLNCFFSAGANDGQEADYGSCLKQAGVDTSALTKCVARVDKQFGITTKYNDQSSWLSGQFPLYPIYDDLNNKYGVRGSPTLVINGAEVSASRTPEAVKQAVCASFETAPAECQQTLSTQAAVAGFGTGAGTGTTANCNT